MIGKGLGSLLKNIHAEYKNPAGKVETETIQKAVATNRIPLSDIQVNPKNPRKDFDEIALQELREVFELNNVPVTDTFTSDPINIPAGYDHIAFNNGSNPSLPTDFVEPKVCVLSNPCGYMLVNVTVDVTSEKFKAIDPLSIKNGKSVTVEIGLETKFRFSIIKSKIS